MSTWRGYWRPTTRRWRLRRGRASDAAGLPAIQVSPPQGKLLNLLARSIEAKTILEKPAYGERLLCCTFCHRQEGRRWPGEAARITQRGIRLAAALRAGR